MRFVLLTNKFLKTNGRKTSLINSYSLLLPKRGCCGDVLSSPTLESVEGGHMMLSPHWLVSLRYLSQIFIRFFNQSLESLLRVKDSMTCFHVRRPEVDCTSLVAFAWSNPPLLLFCYHPCVTTHHWVSTKVSADFTDLCSDCRYRSIGYLLLMSGNITVIAIDTCMYSDVHKRWAKQNLGTFFVIN